MAGDETDLGTPVAWLALERGVPVLDPDGEEVGRLERVVGDDRLDIFAGLVVARGVLGGDDLWVDETQVDALHERGVLLAVEAAELKVAR